MKGKREGGEEERGREREREGERERERVREREKLNRRLFRVPAGIPEQMNTPNML